MDINDRIKDIKTMRFFPDVDPQYCKLCGKELPYSFDYTYEDDGNLLCTNCLNRKLDNFEKSWNKELGKKKKPFRKKCEYCLKVKKLMGKWCRSCRNDKWRRNIKELLAKDALSVEEQVALDFYKRQPIWKKEFKKHA